MRRIATFSSTVNPCRAYTLIELAVSVPIMALLTLGLAAAIQLSTKAVPDGKSISSAALVSVRAMDQLAGELPFATSIITNVTSAGAARQVTFTIPDRDSAAPTVETVTYSWSGVAGDPLLRTFNGTIATVAANVQEFNLTYEKTPQTVVTTSTAISTETLLVSADGSSGAGDFVTQSGSWSGAYVLPVLSANITGWKVTKVQFRARRNGTATGQIAVRIRDASNRLPTTTVLDQTTLVESDLSTSYTLRTFTFSNVPVRSPTQGICLTLETLTDANPGDIQFWSGGTAYSNLLTTTNSGSSWTSDTSRSLRYYVYGTLTTDSTSSSVQYRLARVRCTLRTGGSAASRLVSSVRILNQPQVTGP